MQWPQALHTPEIPPLFLTTPFLRYVAFAYTLHSLTHHPYYRLARHRGEEGRPLCHEMRASIMIHYIATDPKHRASEPWTETSKP